MTSLRILLATVAAECVLYMLRAWRSDCASIRESERQIAAWSDKTRRSKLCGSKVTPRGVDK